MSIPQIESLQNKPVLHNAHLLLFPEDPPFDLPHVVIRFEHFGVEIIGSFDHGLSARFPLQFGERPFDRKQRRLIKVNLSFDVIVHQFLEIPRFRVAAVSAAKLPAVGNGEIACE